MTVLNHDFQGRVPPLGGNDEAARRDEYALIERIRAGDADAFETMVDTHITGVTRFAHAIVGSLDVADDVVQAVFVQLWERRASLDHILSLSSYLFRLVRNRALNERKADAVRERHRDRVQADIVADATPVVVTSPEGAVLDEVTLERGLGRLSEQRRLALRLRFNDQLTHEEIGDVLEISTEAARKLVFRAVQDLREILGVSG